MSSGRTINLNEHRLFRAFKLSVIDGETSWVLDNDQSAEKGFQIVLYCEVNF